MPAGRRETDGANADSPPVSRLRLWIAQAFGRAEDVVYVGLGILLVLSAEALPVSGAVELGQGLAAGRGSRPPPRTGSRLAPSLRVAEGEVV